MVYNKHQAHKASQALAQHHQPLIEWEKYGEAAHLSIPTPEHYWPALYTLALQHEDEQAKVFIDGIVSSTMYQLTYKTGDFDLRFDDPITVNSVKYKVKDTLMIDDGAFSKVMLAKI